MVHKEVDILESNRYDYLHSLFSRMSRELKKVGCTRKHLWNIYREEYPNLPSYSRFCELYRIWSYGQSPVMRFVHKAGDKMFVDFTGKELSIIQKETGEIKELEVFVGILGASGYTYVEAVSSQKKEDFIQCLVHALEYFEGVPSAIVTDNLKSAVTKSSKYEPIINEDLLSFSLYYNTTILPTRAYKPKDKGLVENAVKLVYNRIFAPINTKVYHDLKSINNSIKQHLQVHNSTHLQARKCSRLDLFENIDQPALGALPSIGYQIKEYRQCTVYKTSHVYLNKDKHYYSVPYKYIGKKVKIAFSKDTVEIYHKQERIALHTRHQNPYV